MRQVFCTLWALLIYLFSSAQTFEGILQIDYRAENGIKNAVDVYVKGDRFFLRRVFGGCGRYDSYIFDTRSRIMSCLSSQSPRTALSLDIDKVLDIYESRQLRPGYKIHVSHPYSATGLTKKIADLAAEQKKTEDPAANYEIWIADLKINIMDLVPVLRVLGFWGEAEDGENLILESKIIHKKTNKAATTNVTPVKSKVDDYLFKIPQDYQQVDLDKFLVNEYKSPRFGDLVKAFTGFMQ